MALSRRWYLCAPKSSAPCCTSTRAPSRRSSCGNVSLSFLPRPRCLCPPLSAHVWTTQAHIDRCRSHLFLPTHRLLIVSLSFLSLTWLSSFPLLSSSSPSPLSPASPLLSHFPVLMTQLGELWSNFLTVLQTLFDVIVTDVSFTVVLVVGGVGFAVARYMFPKLEFGGACACVASLHAVVCVCVCACVRA